MPRRVATVNQTRPFFPPPQRKTAKSGLATRDYVLRASLKWTHILWVIDTKIIHVYSSMFHLCEVAQVWNGYACEILYSMRVKYYSTRVKCYSTRVTWNFTREVHIYTLRETCSTKTRDVNSMSSCRVSMRVHAPRFEVIIKLYCMYITVKPFMNSWWHENVLIVQCDFLCCIFLSTNT